MNLLIILSLALFAAGMFFAIAKLSKKDGDLCEQCGCACKCEGKCDVDKCDDNCSCKDIASMNDTSFVYPHPSVPEAVLQNQIIENMLADEEPKAEAPAREEVPTPAEPATEVRKDEPKAEAPTAPEKEAPKKKAVKKSVKKAVKKTKGKKK